MKKKITFHIILVASIFALVISCRKNETAQTTPIPPTHITENLPPVAMAGPDQTITLPLDIVVLDGSHSFDPNGIILWYRWRVISTTFTPMIAYDTSKVTTVNFTHAGTYYFELNVIDSSNMTSKDTCKIVVLQQPTVLYPNISLSVDILQYDTLLNLPVNSITLNANAYLNGPGPQLPAPVIKSIEWKKIAGPDNFSIQFPDKLVTTINNLTPGMYAFECKIADTAERKASMVCVIRVSNPAAPEHELVIQNLKWESNAMWAPTIELNLNLIIPINKCIKKVMVKTACDTNYTEALPLWLFQNPYPHYYYVYYYNNQLRLSIDIWSPCQTGTADIKIIYS